MPRRSVTKLSVSMANAWPGRHHPPPGISERNWQIAIAYVEEDRSWEEIAHLFDISHERVRQILEEVDRINLKTRYELARARRLNKERFEQREKDKVRCTPEQRAWLFANGRIHWRWLDPHPGWLVEL